MIEDIKKILDRLDTPADWAIVVGAGTAGFVLDGLFNIVAPFSPAICGMTFASAAFTAKRGYDAVRKAERESAVASEARRSKQQRLENACRIATEECARLTAAGRAAMSRRLQLEIDLALAEGDPESLIHSLRQTLTSEQS